MNPEEKLEILKHIKLGTKEVLYYPYNEGKEPLPLRPISSYEVDEAFYNSLEYTPEKIAHLVVNLRVNLVRGEERIKLSNEGYSQLIKFYDDIDYWVVYFGMKDFQDDEFTKPDPDTIEGHPIGFYIVKKMRDVHEIADFILKGSISSEIIVKEIFEDDSGKELAYVVFYLNQELAPLDKLTKLQRRYLIYSKGHITPATLGDIKKGKYSISGETMTVQDLLNKFGVDVE